MSSKGVKYMKEILSAGAMCHDVKSQTACIQIKISF